MSYQDINFLVSVGTSARDGLGALWGNQVQNAKDTKEIMDRIGSQLCSDNVVSPEVQTVIYSMQFVLYFITLIYYLRKLKTGIAGWIKCILVYNNLCLAVLIFNSFLKQKSLGNDANTVRD